jgi:hypothetical protein
MYPPSRFAEQNGRSVRSGGAPKVLAGLAALVLFFAIAAIFVGLRPGPSFVEELGVRVPSCSVHFAGKQPFTMCQTITPNAHLVLRIGIGVVATAIVVVLSVAAARLERNLPALA